MTSIKMPSHSIADNSATENGSRRRVDGPFDLESSSFTSADGSVWDMPTPVVAWLVACLKPAVVVNIDLAGDGTTSSVNAALQRFAPPGSCISVTSTDDWTGHRNVELTAAQRSSGLSRPTTTLRRAKNEASMPVDLLRIHLADDVEDSDISIEPWLGQLQPGSVIVLSGGGRGADRSTAWKQVSDRYAIVTLSEVRIALTQVPIDGRSPLVDALSAHPPVRAQLALLAERGEYRYVTGEPLTTTQLRDEIERRDARHEIDANAAREGLARLRDEIGQALEARRAAEDVLSQERERHIEELRTAIERVTAEFQADNDLLAAKVAMSAAKYERIIAEIRTVTSRHQGELECQLNDALTEIAALRGSTSWRLTSAMRAFSSIMRRISPR